MPNVLVYGGAGQLGDAVVACFRQNEWDVVSADFRESASASSSIILHGNPQEDAKAVLEALDARKGTFDALVNVAGGWAGGGIKNESVFESVDKMWKFNVQSAVAASHIASALLREGGLLVLTGASAALGGTPGMIGYGISKAATHHLIKSLAAEGSGLPAGVAVAGILPICLDTATNRQGMPSAKWDDWTPLPTVAELLFSWTTSDARPESGALVELVTKDGKTEFKTHA
eukprot:TRINITY_DN822_c0_g1_i1.p1 TRINITY_DN822_c0_g1~~TRINITY_DN822_c0_g1_i1.p1  ORF type:complete len:231 (-),score=74.56 TRINITY_DN822_c0_g1_i1:105-797(-)